jgi:hypothetical protein
MFFTSLNETRGLFQVNFLIKACCWGMLFPHPMYDGVSTLGRQLTMVIISFIVIHFATTGLFKLMPNFCFNHRATNEPYGRTSGSQINPSSNGQLIFFFGCGVLLGAHSTIALANHQWWVRRNAMKRWTVACIAWLSITTMAIGEANHWAPWCKRTGRWRSFSSNS